MEEVTAYKSQDGQVFATVARCLEHEAQFKMELFFKDSRITSAEGFRRAIINFQDYVKNVLAVPDVTPEPTPAFVPVFSEEKAREREFQEARQVLIDYLEDFEIEDIVDLEKFVVNHGEALKIYIREKQSGC